MKVVKEAFLLAAMIQLSPNGNLTPHERTSIIEPSSWKSCLKGCEPLHLSPRKGWWSSSDLYCGAPKRDDVNSVFHRFLFGIGREIEGGGEEKEVSFRQVLIWESSVAAFVADRSQFIRVSLLTELCTSSPSILNRKTSFSRGSPI